jgi:hypothetical protein
MLKMKAWMLVLVAMLVLAQGCKTVEVCFVAKYQRGPVSLEFQTK